MDVADQPSAQVEQRLLAPSAETDDRVPLGDSRDDEGDGRDHTEDADESDADVAFAHDAAVDRLLEEDRHDDPPDGADGRQQPRHAESLAQDRRLLQPAADRVDGRESGRRSRVATGWLDEQVSHGSLPTSRSTPVRSASNASTSWRYPALRDINSACGPWSTTVPRST